MREKDSSKFQETVNKASALDADAFEEFYREYITPIYRYFIIRTQNKSIAEDLTHTVFIKAWENKESLKDVSGVLVWLYTIARNTQIDYWRKKKEVFMEDVSVVEDNGENPSLEDLIDIKEDINNIKEAMEDLSDEQKEVITLKFFEGFSNKEIEKIMKKSSTAIRALQYRALKEIKEIIHKENNGR